MNKLANNLKKEKCTGCRACEQICPKKCIKMIEDEEGFFYPIKNEEKCVGCDLCKKICPIYDVRNDVSKSDRKVFALRHKDDEILSESSSGGAFSAIMTAFCKDNYVIFGVKYDEKFKVIHDYVFNIEDAKCFKKSKYVQSDIRNSYKKAKEFLEEGKKILFTGTPCQIAGLKKYLGNDYENLLMIDIICRGVASQKVFDKYIVDTQNKCKNKILNINFREKINKNNKCNSKNIRYKLQNKKIIIEDAIKNVYLRGYHKALFYRPSCEKCDFANQNRLSDITISDCWGIQKKYPEIDAHNESMIVLNTEKGNEILTELNKECYLKELDLQFAIDNNAQFREPCKFDKNRKEFFENIDKENFYKLVDKYVHVNKFKLFMSRIIPERIKKTIKKLIS